MSKLCKTNQVSIEFFPNYFLVKDLVTRAQFLQAENVRDVYYTSMGQRQQINVTIESSITAWHHQFGHPSNNTLRKLINCYKIGIKSADVTNFNCPSCNINKSPKLPFSKNSLPSSRSLQLLYTDVWSTSGKSVDGYSYYVIFVEFFTKYIWLYPLKKKSDVFFIFPQFKRLVENFFDHTIVYVFSNNGGEFVKLIPLFNSCGI